MRQPLHQGKNAKDLVLTPLYRCLAGVALGALFFAPSARAQDARGTFIMPAAKTPAPPTIDGVIGSEWRDASRGENFIQFEPNRGDPSPLQTVVYVQYDDEHLYIAFEAHDPEPLMGQMVERDASLWEDDSVQIYIDTFHDARSGYFFMTNVLGTQLDGRIAEDGNSNDDTWDAPWDSATQRTDYGYSVEVSIPFSTVQYEAGSDITWGINFARTRRRTLERSYWAGPVDAWGRVSQAGDLVGLDVRPQTRRHQFIPYVLGQAQQTAATEGALGLDFRYAVTPQTSAYATLNPDFATIEADQEEINLSRFELSLTEKRQFFLEGQELFNQRIQTFYSRRIGDISVGAKTLGRQSGWTFAMLSTTGDIDDDRAVYSVARVQRDVSSRSNVGVLFANRGHAGRQQGSAGLDVKPVLFRYVRSHGPADQELRRAGRRHAGLLCTTVLRFVDRARPRAIHASRRRIRRQRQHRGFHPRRQPARARWRHREDRLGDGRGTRTNRVRLQLQRVLGGGDDDAPQLAGGSLCHGGLAEPPDDRRFSHRGVQAIREGLPQPPDQAASRLQHALVRIDHRRPHGGTELRCRLPAMDHRRCL